MPINEMRKDYLLDRWVVFASQRRIRPSDLAEAKREEKRKVTCPFCPGNENLTPPASLLYLMENGKIRKDRDEGSFRNKDWVIRCIPNLYPAFSPPEASGLKRRLRGIQTSTDALGHHEVLIESPIHDEHPSTARISQIVHVINAIKDRVSFLLSREYVEYVSIFRNHGASAGASLSHAHTQIISTPLIPKIIKEEIAASKKHYKIHKECIFCSIIKMELESDRFIWENDSFTAFSPWAATNPFEFWIFPKRHQASILEISDTEVEGLAKTIRVSLGGLKGLLNDPPYNLGFHMARENHYHWHIEVYPKLSIWAGFEKSTGMFINVMPPEESAKSLREAFKGEEKLI